MFLSRMVSPTHMHHSITFPLMITLIFPKTLQNIEMIMIIMHYQTMRMKLRPKETNFPSNNTYMKKQNSCYSKFSSQCLHINSEDKPELGV